MAENDGVTLKTEAEYERAVGRIAELFPPKPDTGEEAELRFWVAAVKAYMNDHLPRRNRLAQPPTPEAMADFRREQEQ